VPLSPVESQVIPYEALLRELELSDTRTVEDVIIEGMYAGLFKGKLDQKKKQLQVHETAGRDCKRGQAPRIGVRTRCSHVPHRPRHGSQRGVAADLAWRCRLIWPMQCRSSTHKLVKTRIKRPAARYSTLRCACV
jgi:hypothetical protein